MNPAGAGYFFGTDNGLTDGSKNDTIGFYE